jgi:hypothetical protein
VFLDSAALMLLALPPAEAANASSESESARWRGRRAQFAILDFPNIATM